MQEGVYTTLYFVQKFKRQRGELDKNIYICICLYMHKEILEGCMRNKITFIGVYRVEKGDLIPPFHCNLSVFLILKLHKFEKALTQ